MKKPKINAFQSGSPKPEKVSMPSSAKQIKRDPQLSKRHEQTQSTLTPLSKQDSMIASKQDNLIETIRKTVKKVGREVSFVRLSPEEKNQLTDIVYTYKRHGKKTSENEVSRIAINFMLEDYKANGKKSVLAKVIEALLS